MAGEQAWWHAKGGEKFGPHSDEELRKKAAEGHIGDDDLVWAEGMTDWVAAASVEGLLPVKQAVRVSSQPPPLPTTALPPVTATRTADAGWSAAGKISGIDAAAAAGTHQRVYHAPRLDVAFNAQPQILKIGKFVVPLVTLMTFASSGAGWGTLAVIGLAAYWMTLLKNKGDLELVEKELYALNAKDGLQHDITDLTLLRYRFGPGLAFFGSVLAVIFIIAKWGLRYIWDHQNG